MVEHPDFINVRKLALVLALSPCALLLALFTLDISLVGMNKTIAARSTCEKSPVVQVSTDAPAICP